jgi:hypothetical protein
VGRHGRVPRDRHARFGEPRGGRARHSEALIATAAGLGAAIPAVIGYNYFVNRVKHWAVEMEGFTLDLLNLLSRPAAKAG